MSTIAIEYSHDGLVKCMRRAAAGLAMFVGITLLAHCGTGCRPVNPPILSDADRYQNAIIECAATAGWPGAYDHAADMKCRNEVNCAYQLPSCR